MNAHLPIQYHNGICFDWFEFTLFDMNYFEAIEFLHLDEFEWLDGYGQNGYSRAIQFQKIIILFEGREDMGVHVRMSGQACRAYENYSKLTLQQLASMVYDLGDSAKMSRCDIAYDDFEGLINLDSITKDVRAGNVVSRFRKGSIIEGFLLGGRVVDCDRTLNFGRQASNVWITIYDKLAERKSKDIVPDCNYWVRCEIKLRHVNASRFVQLLSEGKPLHELYFLVLNNYIRIVVPNGSDSNRWRWEVAEHWARFCNSVINDSISLYVAPSEKYDKYKLMLYVTGQAGAAVYTYIQKFGIKDLMKQVEPKKFSLALKYRELLSDPDDQDIPNGDNYE